MPVPLMNHREPRKNRQVPIWFTEEPPQSSGAVELNATAMRNFLVYMGFHPQQALTRDGTVCYSGWGMRKWPTMYWQMQKGARAADGVYWQKDVVPWAGRRKDFDSAWVQGNCLEVQRTAPASFYPLLVLSFCSCC